MFGTGQELEILSQDYRVQCQAGASSKSGAGGDHHTPAAYLPEGTSGNLRPFLLAETSRLYRFTEPGRPGVSCYHCLDLHARFTAHRTTGPGEVLLANKLALVQPKQLVTISGPGPNRETGYVTRSHMSLP